MIRRLSLLWISSLLAVSALSSPPVTRIACVGNSITYGAGIDDRQSNSYPARLQALLGDGYLVGNFGKNGATLLAKGNRPYVMQSEFQSARSFLPQVVFIELGTNDSKPQNRIHLPEFEQDYGALIDSFRTLASSPRIVLLLPPPAFTKDSAGITGNVIGGQIVPLIRAVAYAKGCEVVNLYNYFLDMGELFPDQIHPSARGAALLASRLREFMTMEEDTAYNFLAASRLHGNSANYYGYECLTFQFEGREAKVVSPRRVAAGRPWIWRARFWEHEPQTETALLERGFHLVYCDVSELFGNSVAIGLWEKFYDMLTAAGLSQRAALEGLSRGGMYVYRWAAVHPDRVTCVYADAPVLDMKSWPGGKGKSHGNPELWERFKEDFGLTTEREALAFKGNPLDLAQQIAAGGFPMLHVCGDADETVPVDENTGPFEKLIRSYGGEISVIHKPGVGHYPHSLANPGPIVDFIVRATTARR